MSDQITTTEVAAGAVYSHEKALVDMQVATAKAYPRNVQRSISNAISIVALDKETAASCIYSLPRGGKALTGPSVHLAKIIAQSWGNLRVEARVVDIDMRTVTSQAIAFDLENNLAIKVEVKRSIIGKQGRYNDDMITVTGNAANAIALRNAVLAVVPRQVIDKVYNTARDVITGDLSDDAKLTAKRKALVSKLIDTFKVTEEEVLAVVGKAAIEHIDKDDIVTLTGVGQAIKDGDTTVDQAFGRVKSTRPSSSDEVANEKEKARILEHINSATTQKTLSEVLNLVAHYGLQEHFEAKMIELKDSSNTK